jgi:DNA-binding LytR/AlgR family response regulator
MPVKVLIIEDELPAAKRLKKLLAEMVHDIEVINHCESLVSCISYFESKPEIDLIFMDIRLGDGISLDLFQSVAISAPEYMLKAFKVHSIDYLLKPIEMEELAAAIEKFQTYFQRPTSPQVDVTSLLHLLQAPVQKERFLIKTGAHMVIVPTAEIQYFYTEDGYSFIVTAQSKKYIVDQTLDQLQREVNPKEFFRINRSMLVRVSAIQKVEQYFNSRYALELSPAYTETVVVAREKVKDFKEWLES